jgi:hypothetical protein
LWLSEWLKKRNDAQSVASPKRLRILAVSISREDIFLLEYLGDHHQWELKFTRSPQEAFRLASESDFDLIFCDRPVHREAAFCWSLRRMTTTCGGLWYTTGALMS